MKKKIKLLKKTNGLRKIFKLFYKKINDNLINWNNYLNLYLIKYN